MKQSSFILALFMLFAFSSSELSAQKLKNSKTERISKTSKKTVGDALPGEYFGEKFKISSPTAVENVIKRLGAQDTMEVQVIGVVQKVCKSKGCWTNVGSRMDSEQNLFVKFKDYGFFLPLDCDGKNIVLNGKAYIEVTAVEELRHYAEDEGKSAEEVAKITEPAMEYKFMATGAFLKSK